MIDSESKRERERERESEREREREREQETERDDYRETYVIDLLISLYHDAEFSENIDQFFIHTLWVHFQGITQHLNGLVCLLSLMIKLSIIIIA